MEILAPRNAPRSGVPGSTYSLDEEERGDVFTMRNRFSMLRVNIESPYFYGCCIYNIFCLVQTFGYLLFPTLFTFIRL